MQGPDFDEPTADFGDPEAPDGMRVGTRNFATLSPLSLSNSRGTVGATKCSDNTSSGTVGATNSGELTFALGASAWTVRRLCTVGDGDGDG